MWQEGVTGCPVSRRCASCSAHGGFGGGRWYGRRGRYPGRWARRLRSLDFEPAVYPTRAPEHGPLAVLRIEEHEGGQACLCEACLNEPRRPEDESISSLKSGAQHEGQRVDIHRLVSLSKLESRIFLVADVRVPLEAFGGAVPEGYTSANPSPLALVTVTLTATESALTGT